MANSRLLLSLACVSVSVCAACGSSFVGDGTGTSGSAGAADAGGSAAGSSAAGGPSGGAGATSAGAGGASGGTTSVGGTVGSSGGPTSAGAGGSSGKGGAAGSTGTAGNPGTAGSTGTAGTGGAPDCTTLKAEYATLLEKARMCDKGSTDQCSASSTLPTASSCGCPVLVNATADATVLAQKKYKQLQDNKCLNTGGIICAACIAVTGASCAQQSSGMGSGGYVCTGSAI